MIEVFSSTTTKNEARRVCDLDFGQSAQSVVKLYLLFVRFDSIRFYSSRRLTAGRSIITLL